MALLVGLNVCSRNIRFVHCRNDDSEGHERHSECVVQGTPIAEAAFWSDRGLANVV
jgi:hypothetical protein